MPGRALISVALAALLFVSACANRAPNNVDFSVTKAIPHDGNKDTSRVTVELAPVAIDPDGDPMHYHWKCPSAVSSRVAHVEVLTAVFPAAGSFNCQLNVTDAYGVTTTGTVGVTINAESNTVPVANAGSNTAWTVPHDEAPSTASAGPFLLTRTIVVVLSRGVFARGSLLAQREGLQGCGWGSLDVGLELW